MSEKINAEIEKHVRNNTIWPNLPIHIKQVLRNSPDEYKRYVFSYSVRNQLRHRGNLVRKIFKNEERYYELLIEKSINNLCLFPYHLSDIVTKGLRVTPFNYYIEVICNFLKNEKSYDTLPNFTAADCLRVLGIGRNEYLSLASQLKTNSSKLFRKPNPKHILPKFPIKINIEPWWKIEIGYVLENDIKFVSDEEKNLIDDLIDSGPQIVGECDYSVVHGLYRKGLVYLDVPINDDDKICIPPLRNFVMNRLSGDYFENLLYKIFVSADEHMSINELSKVLQIDLETVKYAVSLICRLGFAKKKLIDIEKKINLHESWLNHQYDDSVITMSSSCSLNYNALLMHSTNSPSSSNTTATTATGNDLVASNKKQKQHQQQRQQQQQISPKQQSKIDNSIEYISSDGNTSDFSFTALPPVSSDHELNKTTNKENSENDLSSEIEDISCELKSNNNNISGSSNIKPSLMKSTNDSLKKNGKRIGFLFDSTLTAFLMMGNLSPGLKNHAVTMFEVGKLCEESMDTFLSELEKVSLLDAEGEGEVSRYFAHAVILRSTIIALRNAFDNGLDLLRLECLDSLDYKTRDRLLEKKYKFIISASPLTGFLSHPFTIPFFGQFYRSSETSHIWSKLFYYHISGYGPPSLFLTKGTVLKSLPRLFLGYGKLLVTIVHTDSYIISSENYHNINDQLRNDCVLVQGYGIRQIGQIKYESFPFDKNDPLKIQWSNHKAIIKLNEHLNLNNNCGYVTFVNTGVPDIGCEYYDINVHLIRTKMKRKKSLPNNLIHNNYNHHNYLNSNNENDDDIMNMQKIEPNHSTVPSTPTTLGDLCSPIDNSEVTSFNRSKNTISSNTDSIVMTSTVATTSSSPSSSAVAAAAIVTTTKVIDHLKTPDENYFAITPQNSSPSNIYRSDDCNEILATVLDNLANLNKEDNDGDDNDFSNDLADKHLNFVKNDNNTITRVRNDDQYHHCHHNQENEYNSINNDDEDTVNDTKLEKTNECNNGEIWTLLDVHFGVPLFDADCNTRICEHIVKHLCSDENLEGLPSSHAAMNEKFLKFVKQCLYFEDECNDIIKIGKLLPQPRINLAFENGKICYWSGK